MVEIVDERVSGKILMKQLPDGDYFMYNGDLYIKIFNCGYCCGVNLKNGFPSEIDDNEVVEKVTVKIIIYKN